MFLLTEMAFYALKRLQTKKRKIVDRRASKSRKIRLVQFRFIGRGVQCHDSICNALTLVMILQV